VAKVLLGALPIAGLWLVKDILDKLGTGGTESLVDL
jgi:hypothetical protein